MGLVAIYLFIKAPQTETVSPLLRYLPFVLFAASVAVRWAVLPQVRLGSKKTLPVFVLGLAPAEICTIAGIFLVLDSARAPPSAREWTGILMVAAGVLVLAFRR